MTIEQLALSNYNGSIDIDVRDTETDMYVGLVYDIGTMDDAHDKFLDILCKNVNVINVYDDYLICDFSGYYKQFNDAIYEYLGSSTHNLSKDEIYLALTDMTELLIPGFCSEATYIDLIDILTQS